ncbi:hypothetical protein MRBBS_0453 [Marinobacter sp. BSs20148]|nr:hypothetical protein MRBBS_0453 [Marinobacter sp. BSs20148]
MSLLPIPAPFQHADDYLFETKLELYVFHPKYRNDNNG